jgi:hypothetical protein
LFFIEALSGICHEMFAIELTRGARECAPQDDTQTTENRARDPRRLGSSINEPPSPSLPLGLLTCGAYRMESSVGTLSYSEVTPLLQIRCWIERR